MMSEVTQTDIAYDDLKDVLKSFGVADPDVHRIFSYINGRGYCRIGTGDIRITVERNHSDSYDVSMTDAA